MASEHNQLCQQQQERSQIIERQTDRTAYSRAKLLDDGDDDGVLIHSRSFCFSRILLNFIEFYHTHIQWWAINDKL